MIWNDPALRKKKEDGYISKDPVILQAAEALASYNGKWHFPKGPNGGGSYAPIMTAPMESSTGIILPSDFDGPGSSSYNAVYGAITCTYSFYQRKPREIGPYIIAIGDKNNWGVSGGYLHNIVSEPFISSQDMIVVSYMYPGINVQDMYPDAYPVAVAAIANPDGTISHVPLASKFVSDYEIKITFPEEICNAWAIGCGSAEMTECLYGEPN